MLFLDILNPIVRYIMSIASFIMVLGEGVIDFTIVALFLAGSVLCDCCRFLDTNKEMCLFAFKIMLPILLITLYTFRESLYRKYKGKLEEKLGEVIEVVSPPPPVRRSKEKKWADDMYDTDSFDDLNLTDEVSTIDYSNESVEWDTKERKNILAQCSAAEILEKSTADPRVLVGWRISLSEGREKGVVLATVKKKFSTTRFTVEMSDCSIRHLKLQRSATKGNVPFLLLEKLF